jgi:hypothetical protein
MRVHIGTTLTMTTTGRAGRTTRVVGTIANHGDHHNWEIAKMQFCSTGLKKK